MSGRKGADKERQLRRKFEEAGWFANRGPASAGGYDLIAAKDGHVIVMELKYVSAGETVYFDHDELFGGEREDGGIVGVAEDFGGNAYAVVRWKRDTNFYAFPPRMLKHAGKNDDGKPMVKPADKKHAIEFPPLGFAESEEESEVQEAPAE